MTIEIKVPEIAESVSEAVVGKWLKSQGDEVRAGDVLLELETDKVNVEVTAPQNGTLQQVVRTEGDSVKVGDVLGSMEAGKVNPVAPTPASNQTTNTQAPITETVASQPATEVVTEVENTTADDASANTKIATGEALATTPLARKLAEGNGILLSTVRGTGVGGRVTRSDVELAITERDAANAYKTDELSVTIPANLKRADEREIIKLSRRRITIMERMSQINKDAVMTTTYNEVDMSEVIAIRKLYKDYFKDKYNVGLGFMSFFLKAAVMALSEYKILNAELSDNQIMLKYYYHIGVAVASDDGLVVPVIRDVDQKSFAQIETELKQLIIKTRQGKLKLSDLVDGTFTITNGGVFGSLMSTPIINPPQAGILGLHGIKEKPVAIDGQVVIRPIMYLATTYDHRFVEGQDAIKFLTRVKELIEQPALLLVEG